MTRTTEVAIIGAGISGLTTAHRLTQRGHEVVVLEASDRVGGRTINLDVGGGVITEGGGQWIGPLHTRLLSLIDELGLTTFKTFTDGRTIYLRHGNRRTYEGTIPPMSPRALADFAQAQLRLGWMARSVPAAAPWAARRAERWDAITLGSWLDRNVRTAEARKVFLLGFALIFAESAHQISLLKALHQITTSGGIDFMMNVADGAQDMRVVGGTAKIAHTLADRLGDRVVLDTPVDSIDQDGDVVTVRTAHDTIHCQRVIVAMTPADAQRIAFRPELPMRRAQLQRLWRNGRERKVFAVYDRPFWREEGLNGSALTDLPVAHFVADNSPPDGSVGILVSFVGIAENGPGPTWSRSVIDDAEARQQAFVSDLVTLFGPRARDIDRYVEQSWVDEPWIAGVAGIRAPGVITTCTDAGVTPVGRIHWAGAESSVEFESYLEGAVRAAERAAEEVDRALRLS
ncbi:FAD-dependent oxidoreductase [Nocardioides maradonensis]